MDLVVVMVVAPPAAMMAVGAPHEMVVAMGSQRVMISEMVLSICNICVILEQWNPGNLKFLRM